jgi:hypothetical protein
LGRKPAGVWRKKEKGDGGKYDGSTFYMYENSIMNPLKTA